MYLYSLIITNDSAPAWLQFNDEWFQRERLYMRSDCVNVICAFESEQYNFIETGLMKKTEVLFVENGLVYNDFIFSNRENISCGEYIDIMKKFMLLENLAKTLTGIDHVLHMYTRHFLLLNRFALFLASKSQDVVISSAVEMKSIIFTTMLHYYAIKKNIYLSLVTMYKLTECQVSNLHIIWPCFNLPPGFGKTFQIEQIQKTRSGKTFICCPTARAKLLYTNANTIHSFFMIDFRKPYAKLNIPLLSNRRKNISNSDNLFVFDEFSMIPKNVMERVVADFLEHYSLFAVFSGDSAQMPPPKSGMIDFNSLVSRHSTNQFKIVTCVADVESPLMRIPRFSGSSKLQNLILYLKSVIDMKKKNRILTTLISEDKLIELASRFKIFSLKEDTILDTELVSSACRKQNEAISALLTNNFDKIPDPQCIIGYTNSYCIQIHEKILSTLDKEFESLANRITINGRSCSSVINIPSIIITKEKLSIVENIAGVMKFKLKDNNKSLEKKLRELPGTVGSEHGIMKVGCFVTCRLNHETSVGGRTTFKVYNGMCGILVGIDIQCASISINEATNILTFNNILEFDNGNDKLKILPVNDINDFVITYRIYMFDSKKIIKSQSLNISTCDQCKDDCNHSPCASRVFYWQPNYAVTVQCLQGITILDEKLTCVTNKTLKQNKLRTAYTILSRVAKAADLEIDRHFVSETISSILDNSIVALSVSKKNFHTLTMPEPVNDDEDAEPVIDLEPTLLKFKQMKSNLHKIIFR